MEREADMNMNSSSNGYKEEGEKIKEIWISGTDRFKSKLFSTLFFL